MTLPQTLACLDSDCRRHDDWLGHVRATPLDDNTKLKATSTLRDVFGPENNNKTIRVIVERPQPGEIAANIKTITDTFFAPQGSDVDVATFLDSFVRGQINIPLTTGNIPGLPNVKPRKNGSLVKTCPSLLFVNLPDPSSSNTQARYPSSDAIFQRMQKCSDSSSTIPIFGVSGCGKTRGLIEVLSRRWGFYFNASADDFGSRDITMLISHVGSRLKDREANNRQARTVTFLLFLSRLKILQHYLTISGNRRVFTCARWVLLQTCSHVLHGDIFAQLFEKLFPFSDLCQTPEGEAGLEATVREEFEVTKRMLEKHGKQGGLPSFNSNDKLFVVHDEAQILGDTWDGRFKSMSPGEPDRPLLSPILWGFRKISESSLALITSGTRLSIYTLDWARNSGAINKGFDANPRAGKNSFDYIEFPGWTGREDIEAYVAGLRCLLPTEGARQALDSLLPPEAIQAITDRFVSRFLLAVSAVERTITRSEQNGWVRAVEDTERRLVSFEFRKEQGNLCYEIIRLEKKFRDNLDTLNTFHTVEEVLGSVLFQRYMFGADTLVLSEAVPELVEHALGRIKTINGVEITVIDEPFALKAAENYFKQRDSGFMKTLEYWVRQSDKSQAHGYAWELMMMNVLTKAFKTHDLSQWPFQPSIPILSGDDVGKAVIAGLDEQGNQCGISDNSISMDEFLDAHTNHNSMLDGCRIPPFFFPKAKPSGPDIVFCIQVKGKLFPVFVQLKLRQTMQILDVAKAVKTVSAPEIATHMSDDLKSFCPSENIYISMIIAYPASVVDKMPPRPCHTYPLRIRPGSKQQPLTQVVAIIDYSNIRQIFPKDHVDFLDGIKCPTKAGGGHIWSRTAAQEVKAGING
ncbi:hypothetical protein BGZ83_001720, partial [Gryganskiella cystojenkinii]